MTNMFHKTTDFNGQLKGQLG